MWRYVAVLCAMCAGIVAPSVQAEPIVPKNLPDDVLVIVEVANLSEATGRLQKLAKELNPGWMQVQDSLLGMTRAGLQALNADTIDLTKPVRLVLLGPPLHTHPVVLFTVPDTQAYLGDIPLARKGQNGDVHIFAAGPGAGGEIAIAVAGRIGVMSNAAEAVDKVTKLVNADSLPAGLLKGADLCAMVRINKLLSRLADSGMDVFKMAGDKMDESARMAAQMGMPPQQQKMLKIVPELLSGVKALAMQVEAVQLNISFTPDALVMEKLVQPVKDSGLENYIAETPAGPSALMKYMPADAIGACSAKMGDTKPVADWLVRVAEAFLPEGGEADLKVIRDHFDKWSDAVDEQAGAMLANPDGTLCICVAQSLREGKDPAELQKASMNMMEATGGFQKAMGMKMDIKLTPDAVTHAGHAITEWEITYDILPMEGVDPNMAAQMQQMQVQMQKLIWGEDLKGYSTIIGNHYIYTQGGGALDELKAMIEGKARLAGSDGLKAALPDAPENLVAVGYVSATALMNWYIGLFQRMMGMMMPGMAPNMGGMEAPKADPIGFYCTVAEDRVVTQRLTIPVSVGKSVMSVVQMVMGRMMGGMMMNNQPGGPVAPPM